MTVTRINSDKIVILIKGRTIVAQRRKLETTLGVDFGNTPSQAQQALLDAVGEKGVKAC